MKLNTWKFKDGKEWPSYELDHYANRTLIVSCTKDYTKILGEGLRAVEDP